MKLEDITICIPSLDRGFLDTRLFKQLDSLVQNYSEMPVVVVAQKFTEENKSRLESYKDKLNLETIYYDECPVVGLSQVKFMPVPFAKTDFVFMIDDDHTFPKGAKSDKLKSAFIESAKALESEEIAIAVHFNNKLNKGIERNKLQAIPPFYGFFSNKILMKREDALDKNLLDIHFKIKNLDDMCFPPLMLDKGKLVLYYDTKGCGMSHSSRAEDSFTTNEKPWGVHIKHRMNEVAIVCADYQEKIERYFELQEKLSDKIIKFSRDFDFNSLYEVPSWVRKGKFRKEYEELRDAGVEDWVSVLLDKFYTEIGSTT